MAIRLELSGRNLANNLPYLVPYQQRGDVLVASGGLDSRLQYNQPLMDEYARRQCVNFCIAAIKAGEAEKKRQIVLIDKQGKCVGVAAELLAVCDTVLVVTERPEFFLPCAAYTRETYGTEPLMIGGEVPAVDLVIAPYGTDHLALPSGVLVASAKALVYPKPSDLYVPPYLHAQLPGDMDPLAVTAGLFAAFHPKELMESVPSQIHCGNQLITPKTLWQV